MSGARTLLIAIEAAISGGSISLMENGDEIASRIGSSAVSRAEDLLADLDELLQQNGRRIVDIDLIAVSAGPGSFTGIRIGIATGLGLSTGSGIEMATVSALNAMAHDHSGYRELVVVVPMGRNTVCYQHFGTSTGVAELSLPSTQSEEDFLSSMESDGTKTFLLHEALFQKIGKNPDVINFGTNIAASIGRICSSSPTPRVAPMFISKNQ